MNGPAAYAAAAAVSGERAISASVVAMVAMVKSNAAFGPSPLLGRDNLILTPHTAFYSVEALEELQTKCAADVARVLSGEPPVYPVKAT